MKTALVTGASRGMGLEFCRQLADRGWNVFACARNPGAAPELQTLAKAHSDSVIPLALDVTDSGALEAAAVTALGPESSLDLLVNCAGINSRGVPDEQRNLSLGTLEPKGILRMVEVNAVAPTLITQRLAEHLARSDQGVVLQISSWLGSIAGKQRGGNYGYCASKTTLNMLSRTLAHDLRDSGVIVVAVNPGWVRTDMGGPKGELGVDEAVTRMLDTAERLTLDDSGRFIDGDGTDHAW